MPVTPASGALAFPNTCSVLHAHLPQRLPHGIARRSTYPLSMSTAAWGQPAITLRCGVAPGSPTDDPYTFNDVHWQLHDVGSARRWTTTGLRVNVEVVVPDAYTSQAEILGGLSNVLQQDLGR